MFGLGRAHPIQYTSGPEGLVMALKAVHSLLAFKEREREAECPLICQEQTNCKHKTVICSNPAMFSALPVFQPNKTYFFVVVTFCQLRYYYLLIFFVLKMSLKLSIWLVWTVILFLVVVLWKEVAFRHRGVFLEMCFDEDLPPFTQCQRRGRSL